jgi:hypothetical protein
MVGGGGWGVGGGGTSRGPIGSDGGGGGKDMQSLTERDRTSFHSSKEWTAGLQAYRAVTYCRYLSRPAHRIAAG